MFGNGRAGNTLFEVNCNSSAPITGACAVFFFIPTDVVFMKIPIGNLYTSLTSALLPNDETKQSMLDDMVRKGEAASRDACAVSSRFTLPL